MSRKVVSGTYDFSSAEVEYTISDLLGARTKDLLEKCQREAKGGKLIRARVVVAIEVEHEE